jgi:hypothetical protein
LKITEKLGAKVLVGKYRERFNGAEEATVLQVINNFYNMLNHFI